MEGAGGYRLGEESRRTLQCCCADSGQASGKIDDRFGKCIGCRCACYLHATPGDETPGR